MQDQETSGRSPESGGGPAVRIDVKSAMFCMALLSRHLGRRLNVETLRHRFGHLHGMGESELVRAFQEVEMKARAVPLTRRKLRSLPLPAIAAGCDGEYFILLSVSGNEALIHRYGHAESEKVPLDDLMKQSTGRLILASCENESATPHDERFGLKWFLRTIFKYRSVMRETLIASFFVQLFALATPLVFMIVIDKVFLHSNLSTLDVLIFALAVIVVFDVVLNGIRTYLLSHTSNRVDVELGTRLFRHLMSLPLSYFESRRTGDTVARIREMETVRNFLTGSTLTLFVDLLFVFIFLGVMYLFSPLLASIVIGALPLFFLVSFLVTPFMRSRLEDKYQKTAESQSFLVETLGGMETVKSGAVEPQQQREWETRLADHARCSFTAATLSNWINQVTGLLSKGLTVVLLYVGANLVLAGSLTVGQLIAFNMLSGRVIAPIQRLAHLWQEFTGMRISVRRLADILDTRPEPLMLGDSTALPPVEGAVEFDQVWFRYQDDNPDVLRNVSFTVEPGEVVGIVGSTGSGKTTLVKLLQRLYVPTSGRVSIDGMSLASLDGAWLRRQIGVVAQDFVLFNRSIRDNITLGDPDIDDQRLVQAAVMVGAHEMITRLPGGYDTVLNERGRGLSAGQRQCIALTRALVTDPSILVLDEATSALDYESEHNFQGNFREICSGRTTFVVAHRLSTVRHADRILTLEDGEIVEDASPAELIRGGGRFASLHELHQNTWPTTPETAHGAG
jgi:ATP-binding cassette, subfamily B, bacterial HlyB/CyaB